MNTKIMEEMGFGKEVKLVADGKCPLCKSAIKSSDFRDQLSRKEYKISGMCQACQDKIFG